MSLTLVCGTLSLGIRPEIGGSISHFRQGAADILRPAPPDSRQPLDMACFPLVPFANRIAGGRFRFENHDVALPVLDAFAPHALHGMGWLRPWQVTSQSADRAELTCSASAGEDGWPWAWRAVQSFRLQPDRLVLTLSVTNEAETAMPAGLGLHPYFAIDDKSRLIMPAGSVWQPGGDTVPDRKETADGFADWRDGPRIRDNPPVDHCYEADAGPVGIDTRAGRVALVSDARLWHVFTPRGEAFACVEPVTHRPDAIHGMIGDMPVLAAGETARIRLEIQTGQL